MQTMRRYVILTHDHPVLHWDLMLETPGGLRTWRLAAPPAAGATCHADALALHRIAYLDYEGPVSRGRGSVSRWDAGTFEWKGDREGEVVVELHGGKYRGRLVLARSNDGSWLCRGEPTGQG
jgi:hypothetical protein